MKEKLKDIIYNSKTNKHTYNVKCNPVVLSWVIENTQHLSDSSTLMERIYCCLHDYKPRCPNEKFSGSLVKGYQFCGKPKNCQCAKVNHSTKISTAKRNMSESDIVLANNKRKETCLRKYGTLASSQSQKVKDKAKKTSMERYGVEYYNNPEKMKETNLERHGVEYYNNQEKAAQTNLMRYGNICSAQGNLVKEQLVDKYGVDSPLKSKELLNKKKATTLERYGDENYTNQEQAKETSMERYGVEYAMHSEEAQQTKKATMNERYGVDNYSQTNECKDQIKITNIKKYGVEHVFQVPAVREQAKQTNLKKYGHKDYVSSEGAKMKSLEKYDNEYPIQSKICKEKTKQTNLKKYGTEYYMLSEDFRNITQQSLLENYDVRYSSQIHYTELAKEVLFSKNKFIEFVTDKTIIEVAQELEVHTVTLRNYISKYECDGFLKVPPKSIYETTIASYLDDIGVTYIQNSRKIISPFELDFYIPEFNIAIEINGNYWHSDNGGGKDRNYHRNKWNKCKEQGITLFQYFEDELINSMDIIKSKIKYLTRQRSNIIGARLCTIGDIEYKQEKEFLRKYHIQGESNSRSKCIGAFFDDELVAVFAWNNRKQYLEITRYACKTDASYPGLFSKMMKHMIRELDYNGDVVSFSNNGHSNGNVYSASGFNNVNEQPPAYWYTNTKNYSSRENRQRYMKSKIKKKFNLSQKEIDSKTEWELMQEQGYDRIWDSGKIKWLKKV